MLLGNFDPNEEYYRPGETCPRSGIYAEVNRQGKRTGERVTSVKGEPFPPPPTEETGCMYVLDVPTNILNKLKKLKN